mgnify:CR=1 FL=1
MQPPYTDEELYFYHQQFVDDYYYLYPRKLYMKGDYSIADAWSCEKESYERELHVETDNIALELNEYDNL